MAENCTHDCSSCAENCSDRDPKSFLVAPHEKTHVKKVIGVVSGKGGVGKSLITSLLACAAAKSGKKTGILDADITGPSIPKMFGLDGTNATGNDEGLFPSVTESGIHMMSINLLLPDSEEPVIWRGPVIAGAVKQFWTDVIWGDLDYLLVDMPPGTGDVPLTVFQSLPVEGVVIVTSPQDLVKMIVGKAVNMAKMMDIPVIGLIENYSYMLCPHCGEKLYPFGQSHVDEAAKEAGVKVLAKIPMQADYAKAADQGSFAGVANHDLDDAVTEILTFHKN